MSDVSFEDRYGSASDYTRDDLVQLEYDLSIESTRVQELSERLVRLEKAVQAEMAVHIASLLGGQPGKLLFMLECLVPGFLTEPLRERILRVSILRTPLRDWVQGIETGSCIHEGDTLLAELEWRLKEHFTRDPTRMSMSNLRIRGLWIRMEEIQPDYEAVSAWHKMLEDLVSLVKDGTNVAADQVDLSSTSEPDDLPVIHGTAMSDGDP